MVPLKNDKRPHNAEDFLSTGWKQLKSAESKLKASPHEPNQEIIKSISKLIQSLRTSATCFNLDGIEEILDLIENFFIVHCPNPKLLNPSHIELLIKICVLLQEMFKQQESTGQCLGYKEKAVKLLQELEQNSIEFQDIVATPDSSVNNIHALSAFEPEMLDLFISESFERLEDAEENLLLMEAEKQDSKQREFLNICFREFHTLKGNSNLIGIQPLEWLMHSAESLLESISSDKRPIREDHYQILLKTIDVFRQALTSLSNNQELAPQDSRDLQSQQDAISDILATEDLDLDLSATIVNEQDEWPIASPDSEKTLIEQSYVLNSEKESMPATQTIKQKDIRVGLDKLDQMLNLVGELVTVANIISHQSHFIQSEENDFSLFINQLQQISNDIHEQTMSMRLVPIANSFRRMSRLVHDISQHSAKQVSLTMSGENTEIDKTLVELIAEPIMHLIRNAIDHGIEVPEERLAAGKPATGKIHLEASQIGNEIRIIVKDDGKGLDREKILKKAWKNGLIEPNLTPPDEAIWKVIFEAGFSTAKEVSALSGRGVGLDIVKKNLDKLSAIIDINSQKDIGTTFTIHFPLTLAVIETLLVKIEEECFSIPLANMIECVELTREDIEKNHGKHIAHIRGEIVPYICLREIFGINSSPPDIEQIVVMEHKQQKIGLLVDQSFDKHQTVIKSLGKIYAEIKNFSGITILGNGKISLIIDVDNLIKNSIKKEAVIAGHY